MEDSIFSKRHTGAKGKLRPHACEGGGEAGLFDDRRTGEKQVAVATAYTRINESMFFLHNVDFLFLCTTY
jgi:hypothetical protein